MTRMTCGDFEPAMISDRRDQPTHAHPGRGPTLAHRMSTSGSVMSARQQHALGSPSESRQENSRWARLVREHEDVHECVGAFVVDLLVFLIVGGKAPKRRCAPVRTGGRGTILAPPQPRQARRAWPPLPDRPATRSVSEMVTSPLSGVIRPEATRASVWSYTRAVRADDDPVLARTRRPRDVRTQDLRVPALEGHV